MLILLSFNYTPPPAEVVKDGTIAAVALFAPLFLVPNIKVGALIGGLGLACIAAWVQSQAGGDMGSLSVITHPPVFGVIGAMVGALVSFLSKSAWQAFRKQPDPKATPDEPE
jgi:hypothetical protein